MTHISRRNVTQGVAWSVPAVVLATAAPASSASAPTGEIPIDCSTVTVTGKTTGLKSWAKAIGTKTSDELYWNVDGNDANSTIDGNLETLNANNGTFWSVNVGQFGPDKPTALDGTNVTGFRIDWQPTAIVRTASGITGTGDVALQGTQSAMVIGAPLQQSLGVQTTIPYKGLGNAAGNTLQSISIPFSITFLDGLSAAARTSNACGGWYINMCFDVAPGPLGNYPVSAGVASGGNAYTITQGPQDPCA